MTLVLKTSTKNQPTTHLLDKIPTTKARYRTRNNIDNILRFHVKYTFYKSSFFPSTVIKWNNLNKSIRSCASFSLFKKSILQVIRLTPNRIFNCHNPTGIKLIRGLSLVLSHLRDHRFKHNFLDCLNPICCCGKDIEPTVRFLLHSLIFPDQWSVFLNNIGSIDENV